MKPIHGVVPRSGSALRRRASTGRSFSRNRPSKILDVHLDRLAVVYVRQSSLGQVATTRSRLYSMRGLRDLAIAWAWHPHRVVVIEDDQARTTTARTALGLSMGWTEVNSNHVGIIFGIEMDRLARSCKDWHDLMEQCTASE